jgi:hypothetical protein
MDVTCLFGILGKGIKKREKNFEFLGVVPKYGA